MKRIITIVGARPQFIKAATISRQFKLQGVMEAIIHTGQHFDPNMSEVFFQELEIPKPAFELNIHGLTHGVMTGRMLEDIENILLSGRLPDGVVVYGDTNSTLAGALAAAKLQIPLIHVEAGLRSFNMSMPEEINRILTDRISNLLLCPTNTAVKNLHDEGMHLTSARIIKNGDVMQDAFMYYASKAQLNSDILRKIEKKRFVLATIHRQSNTDNLENLKEIVKGLNELNKIIPVVMPIHPRTRNILAHNYLLPEFMTVDPVGYFDMIMLLKHCDMVVTDSGGLQKQAFFAQKHCITLREETEWTELVDNGFNMLVGTDSNELLQAYNVLSQKETDFHVNLYGNGTAAEMAVKEIINLLD